jgi:putative membrane protein
MHQVRTAQPEETFMTDTARTGYQWLLSAIVLGLATIYFLIKRNPEFLIYAGTLIIFIGLLAWADRKLHFLPIAKWGFLSWMIMHMAGGSLYIGETRLYDLILIPIFGAPYDVLKYDQFVHFYCYLVMTALMYSVLITIAKPESRGFLFYLVLALASSSIGAFNEIIEFSAVVFFGSTGVGGYHNTCIDLIMNLVGAITACVILHWTHGTRKY